MASYKCTNIWINVEKITLIPYKLAKVQRNFKKIELAAPYERTNIQANMEDVTLIFYKRTNVQRNVENIGLTVSYKHADKR